MYFCAINVFFSDFARTFHVFTFVFLSTLLVLSNVQNFTSLKSLGVYSLSLGVMFIGL